jgi:UDP-glucose 4-epimerase
VALDDLSSGIKERLGQTPLIQLDLASPEAIGNLVQAFKSHNISGVIHLAAKKQLVSLLSAPSITTIRTSTL